MTPEQLDQWRWEQARDYARAYSGPPDTAHFWAMAMNEYRRLTLEDVRPDKSDDIGGQTNVGTSQGADGRQAPKPETSEPVAWMLKCPGEIDELAWNSEPRLTQADMDYGWTETPLYTHPQQTEVVEAFAYFAASDTACYLYPGEDQQAQRAAFCAGAEHAGESSARIEVVDVLRWIDEHGADQDMSHVNFRVGAASRAQCALAALKGSRP